MENGLEITVNAILSRDLFNSAVVAAGEEGLNRNVKWTHILETESFNSFINGGELILTTGSGIQLEHSALPTFKRLIEKKAAGICIEKGPSFSNVSPEVKELADHYHFPIIIFEKTVKFVEITQDLHTLILDQHHQMLNQISFLSKKFTELSLSPNGILKILQQVYASFHKNVLFIAPEEKSYYYPPESKNLEPSLHSYFTNSYSRNSQQSIITMKHTHFLVTPVVVLGQNWGYLVMHVSDKVQDDFLFSVLDRAALALAQILLRNRTIQERKLNMEDEVVNNFLQGKSYDKKDIQPFLPRQQEKLYYRTFIIEGNAKYNLPEEDWEEIKIQRSILFRSLFKRYGCFPAVTARKNEIVIICFFHAEETNKKDTNSFSTIIKDIVHTKEKNIHIGSNFKIGVSSVHKDLSSISESYQEARKVLYLNTSELSNTCYYEEIGIYRLLLQLEKQNELTPYIETYIGKLIEHDQQMDNRLLHTLEVFLECNGSKKDAADRLYIVRQTLYHRLEKIEQLLQMEVSNPLNRLSIETSIKAYKLVKAPDFSYSIS